MRSKAWHTVGGADDEVDRLREVIDPSDAGGAKNFYLDRYLKHYLLKYLDPRPDDVVLEIGSGVGRLVEFVAPRVKGAYGTDLEDDFIRACRAAPDKAPNSHYLFQGELAELPRIGVNKLYVVWVLLCVLDDELLVETLRSYREKLPELRSAVLIEQVKALPEERNHGTRFHSRYRTLEGYLEIFERAGFAVRSSTPIVERRLGPFYQGLRFGYRLLPRAAAPLGRALFDADRRVSGLWRRDPKIIQRQPTDYAFELEPQ
jgi:SAM-dependent methyltransferase